MSSNRASLINEKYVSQYGRAWKRQPMLDADGAATARRMSVG